MSASIWTILGLAATRDEQAIKRAYAAQLKTIDLDSDPARFQELREARDRAIALARSDELARNDGPDLPAEDDGAESSPVEPNEPIAADPMPPERPLDPDELRLQQDHQALCEILFQIHGDTFYHATAEEAAEMLRLFEAMAANPKLQDIGTLANAANWFAGAIAQMIPRSDVLVEPAARAFGWSVADEIGPNPAIAAVVRRREDLAFASQLDHPKNPFHRAWNELRKPADETSSRGWLRSKTVLALLAQIRSDHPGLEGSLDWYRVGLWERGEPRTWGASSGTAALRVFFAIFALLMVISAVTDPGKNDPRQAYASVPFRPVVQGLTSSSGDIDDLMRGMTGGTASGAELRADNPRLYEMLSDDWERAHEQGATKETFLRDAQMMLARRRAAVWSYAPPELLEEKFTFEREVAGSLAAASAEACTHYLEGNSPQLYGSQTQRRDELIAHEIFALDAKRLLPSSTATRTRFVIPPAVMKDMASRMKKSEAVAQKSLRGDLGAAPFCLSHLALYDSVLDLPTAARTNMLRDMASD